MSYFLGVDPGLSGAVAWMSPDAEFMEVHDIPTWQVNGKRVIDYGALAALITPAVETYTEMGVVEHVHAMPKQGVTSSFSFGTAFGACCMAVAASGVPWRLVRPNEWKQKLRVPRDKDAARMVATQLMPWAAQHWRLKKDHNKAEAALLAYYAREISK